MAIEGFVIEGFPVVFDLRQLAIRASFPTQLKIDLYKEEEENQNE